MLSRNPGTPPLCRNVQGGFMTIDRRFPWMISMDTPRVSDRARAAVRQICERTECHAVYDTRNDTAHFYLGNSMAFGVCACPVGGQWDSARIDKQVAYILSGRKPAALKDREVAMAEQAEADAKERELERIKDDMRPDLVRDAKKGLDKAEMGRHWKGRALVNRSK